MYKGKTLSIWIKTYCNPRNCTIYDSFPRPARPLISAEEGSSGTFEFRQREAAEADRRQAEAADAVRQIGAQAVPTLLRGIDSEFPLWKLKLAMVRDKLPRPIQGGHFVDWWLIGADNYRVLHALTGFSLLGPTASPAVPELTRRMNTRTSRSGWWAILALAKIGKDGIQPLLTALADTNALNRVLVARSMDEAIRNQGTNVLPAIQVLAKCVSDHDPGVASWSAITLGFLVAEPKISVPALIDGLSDLRADIRARSGEALGHFGPTALSAVPALLVDLNDPDRFVRTSVTNALQMIAPDVIARRGKE
jgi:HEAT repeat protein